ncbi:MAG: polyphosphate polymerase domain-containing protein [Candidatus Bathyarchaeota archaeon]|nr:polyphosphate polymerase domain-containing protein [Candidatus Bathyarchaeota archaeon]
MSVRRRELKYAIDQLEYQVLRSKLATILKPDPNMRKSNYVIRSLYFDDLSNTAFWEKESGEFHRKKYRLRIYNLDDSLIKFERKSKDGSYVYKETTLVTRENADRLIAGDYSFIAHTDNAILRDFYAEASCKLMRPVVIVEYDREAYQQPIGRVRVTFDKRLRTSVTAKDFFDPHATLMSALDQPNIVLEVKYTEVLPTYLKGLFPDTIKPQLAIGKFSICREQQMCQTGYP